MDLLDPEENFGGITGDFFHKTDLVFVSRLGRTDRIGLCPNEFYQDGFVWPPVAELQGDIINGGKLQVQSVTLIEPSPVGSQPILSQGQHVQPLYANSVYQLAFTWPPVAEPDENIINCENPQDNLLGIFSAAEPQTATFSELPPAGNQPILSQGQQDQHLYANGFYQHAFPWLPVAEPQENVVNAENPQAEPIQELGKADPQPHHLPLPAIPVIRSAADGSGSRLGQKFRCKSRCCGVFVGPHKCSYHGRSLTISCHGDDENCPSEFLRRNDFNRHCNTVHYSTRAGALVKKLLDCPFAGCWRVGRNGFKRKDNLTQHRRNVHEEEIVKSPTRFGRGNDVA